MAESHFDLADAMRGDYSLHFEFGTELRIIADVLRALTGQIEASLEQASALHSVSNSFKSDSIES
jgi:hypothetical protein